MAKQEGGFEYEGTFYPWQVTDQGWDLQLIDRITGGMPTPEFMEEVESGTTRGPVISAMVATSLRHARSDWSIERIIKIVGGLSLSQDITMIGGEEDEEEAPRPPAEGGDSEEPAMRSNGSQASTSETPSEIPA